MFKGMLEELMKKDFLVFLYVNNHYEGSAPITIKRIKEKLLRDVDLSKVDLFGNQYWFSIDALKFTKIKNPATLNEVLSSIQDLWNKSSLGA